MAFIKSKQNIFLIGEGLILIGIPNNFDFQFSHAIFNFDMQFTIINTIMEYSWKI